MYLELVTGPTLEPVTLAEAKAHLRVDSADEDALIAALIRTAREHAETWLRRSLIDQQWRLILAAFADRVDLPKPPVSQINAIEYIDRTGSQQTVSGNVYALAVPLAQVRLAYGQQWPAVRYQFDAVRISYTAGYGAVGEKVPAAIRQGMLMLISHLFENRELSAPIVITEVPQATQALWWPYRWLSVV